MLKEFVDTVMEGYPKSKKALFDDIGVETDEDVGVDIKTF
jgi:26S proteasome regulatory subunit (ATPase 3-interacting protein)